jgi:hypothetical protein
MIKMFKIQVIGTIGRYDNDALRRLIRTIQIARPQFLNNRPRVANVQDLSRVNCLLDLLG